MAMTVEEWNALAEEALNKPDDSATVVSALTKARDAYAELFAERMSFEDESKRLMEENDRLKQTNMDLFLRIGQHVTRDTAEPKKDELTRAETITIDDLFKEDK